MSAPCFDIQRDWDSAGLEGWPTSFDTRYLLGRIAELAVETTAEGATGPVLEVAAAEALHACRLFLLLDVAALEREEPALLRRLLRAEDEALGDPRLRACAAYAVFRKRR